MPPIVARLAVDTSTGNHRPDSRSCRLRSSSTMPGSTTQVPLISFDLDQLVQVLAEIHDQRAADGLAGLRGAAPARQHGHALLARNRQRRAHVVVGARDHHAQGLDLVVRGVGGVAPAREAVEQHLALQLLAQALGEAVGDGICFGLQPLRRYCRFDAPRASRLALLRNPPRYAF